MEKIKAVLLNSAKLDFKSNDGKQIKGEKLTFFDLDKKRVFEKFFTYEKLAGFDPVEAQSDLLTSKIIFIEIEAEMVYNRQGVASVALSSPKVLAKAK